MLEQKCTILNTGAVAFSFKLNTMTTNDPGYTLGLFFTNWRYSPCYNQCGLLRDKANLKY